MLVFVLNLGGARSIVLVILLIVELCGIISCNTAHSFKKSIILNYLWSCKNCFLGVSSLKLQIWRSENTAAMRSLSKPLAILTLLISSCLRSFSL